MKTLAKPFGIFLIIVLTSFKIYAQRNIYEHAMDSATFIYGIEYNPTYINYGSDSLIFVKSINNDKLLANTIRIQFRIHTENPNLDHINIEMKIFNPENPERAKWYKEQVKITIWELDDEDQLGEGTTIIGGERANGEWFVYAQNLENNLYSFHFLDLDKEEETIVYTTKNNKL